METGMVARSQFDRVILLVYSREVVASSRHKGLEELYLTGKTRRIGPEYLRKCVRILQSLEVATQPQDMNVAGYRFRGLRGRPQRWSVHVTGNYRVTFGWSGENAEDVDFEDYH
jgi:toxin HigB-1